ncbi:MAG: aldehyde dehydrogenase family protein, partial [Clostridiales bacterium]|nr:aldehyde dehydrogenase family protein [Clostridiales bacterium]
MIEQIINAQREYFNAGNTLPVAARLKYLKALKSEIKAREADIFAALKSDLNKSDSGAYMVDIGLVLVDLALTVQE